MPLFRWILSSIMGKPARVASLIDVSVTRSRPGCFLLRLVDGGGVEQGLWLVVQKMVKPDFLEGNPMIRHSHSPLSIGAFASAVGVSVVTVRRWCRYGRIREAFRTPGGHRRFTPNQVRKVLGLVESRSRVGYVPGAHRMTRSRIGCRKPVGWPVSVMVSLKTWAPG
ncbi:MerR family DNA-binding transcriptional regulator [Halovibrio salipaludis]|uniref:MerR family DNA-binding transcriptional regulator n=1 Tax=Halovibrio salipaludis TaxID=2032626 RepID=UPI0038B7F29F